jgi:hypothetical protein
MFNQDFEQKYLRSDINCMNDQMKDTSSGEPRSDINCMNDQMRDTSSGEPRSDINCMNDQMRDTSSAHLSLYLSSGHSYNLCHF